MCTLMCTLWETLSYWERKHLVSSVLIVKLHVKLFQMDFRHGRVQVGQLPDAGQHVRVRLLPRHDERRQVSSRCHGSEGATAP